MLNTLLLKDKWVSIPTRLAAICSLLFASCLLQVVSCFSQSNNMYFNQVINQVVTSASCYTVPANKIFKLEGVPYSTAATNTLEFGSACGGTQYGGMNTTDDLMNIGLNTSGDHAWPFPMWFKAGVNIGASAGSIVISGIEFNIAP